MRTAMRTIHTQRDLSGRYEIRLVEPGSWELLTDGIRHSLHRTGSAARSAAVRVESSRRLRLKLFRNGVVVLLIGFGIGLAAGFRTVPNPDYAPARALADRLEAAYLAVVAGDEDLSGFRLESHGFVGASIDGPPAFAIETGEPTDEPARPVRISVLIGELSGTCYSVRWDDPDRPVTGVLRPEYPCTPTSDVGERSSYIRDASSTQPGAVQWYPLLPVPQVQASWFFPVVLLLLGAGLWSAVGITLALHSHRSGRSTSLVWEE